MRKKIENLNVNNVIKLLKISEKEFSFHTPAEDLLRKVAKYLFMLSRKTQGTLI